MSKMGQELERKLGENKYGLLDALKGLLEWARLSFSDDTGDWADENDPAVVEATRMLNKIEGGN